MRNKIHRVILAIFSISILSSILIFPTPRRGQKPPPLHNDVEVYY